MAKKKWGRRWDGTPIKVYLKTLRWPNIDDSKSRNRWTNVHITKDTFRNCNIMVLTEREFDANQRILARIHDKVKGFKAKKKKEKQPVNFDWHSHTNYTEASLLSVGFQSLTTSSLVAVERGGGLLEIIFIYWREPSINGAPMRDLCDHVYHGKRKKRARGDSLLHDGSRGNKTFTGAMDMFGSWNAYGPASQGLGERKKEVRIYNPNGPVDPILNKKLVAHANQLTLLEMALAPICEAQRALVAETLDPYEHHRMTPFCSAFSASTSIGFVIDPHDDSGLPGVLEFVQFLNATGPLPLGHKWQFVIAGFICELPTAVDESLVIALPASGVYHGTLPTSSTGPSLNHGNYGSALVTKRETCNGLENQLKTGRPSKAMYRASDKYFDYSMTDYSMFQGTKAIEQEECVQRKKTQRTAQPNLICDTPGIVAFSPVLDLMDRDFFGNLLEDSMITSPPLNASLAKPGHSVDCSLLFSGV